MSAFAYCVNSNTNTDIENGFRPIRCICICITFDTMLNFDGDVEQNMIRPSSQNIIIDLKALDDTTIPQFEVSGFSAALYRFY